MSLSDREVEARKLFSFLTPEQDRRYKLAWKFIQWKFIPGTGKVTNDPKVVAHYRAICHNIIANAGKE
jgi:hypothetical protein